MTTGNENGEKQGSLRIGFKLTDENYVAWSYAMEILASDAGIWEAIDGKNKDAKSMARAMKAISLNVDEDTIEDVLLGIKDPAAAWIALKTEHAGNTNQDIATLTIQLNTMKLTSAASEESTRAHLKIMKGLAAKLSAADPTRKMSDQALATSMLISLPEEFEPIKLKFLSGPSVDLKPRNIRSEAIAMLKRRSASEGNSTMEHGLAMAA